ncbi:hypothetical protein NODU109028_08765 [Nocardioides dubius]|uniref:hypothetical protein n=1 Tax=Nocardioides dubius TaxID=317019 RepID=UPI0031CEF553
MRSVHAALAGLILAVTVTGCGGDDPAEDPTRAEGTAGQGGADPGADDLPDVPDQCRTPFPQAFGPADLADLALLPDGFPQPPVEATLCITAETVGGSRETASYATSATEEEVLAGYEAALADYAAARESDGIGRPIITASDGALMIQVTPQDGGFVLAFAR